MPDLEAADRLAASRRRVEGALAELQASVKKGVGVDLRRRGWLAPVVAAAAGMALALVVRSRRRRRAG